MHLFVISNMVSPCDVNPQGLTSEKTAGFLEKCPECSPHRLSGTFPAKESGFSNISVLLNANPPAGTVQKNPQGPIAISMPKISPQIVTPTWLKWRKVLCFSPAIKGGTSQFSKFPPQGTKISRIVDTKA